ncbi:MAG: NnrU family protein [Pseudomonadota bacterium]|nr:NnrU family protein [Pseudomonadota bacterium]MEE3099767.1 NnrU family protein [Pseudomonadota bacterium]
MTLLILAIVLWWATHSIPLLAPGLRASVVAKQGEKAWRGGFSLVTLAVVALMVIGYRMAEYEELWFLPWAVHLNNLMMLIAVFLFGASHSKGNVKRYVRHPQLLSVIVWSVAHLLVNGDVASLILFGGLGLWAVAAIFMTNARDGAWAKPAPGPVKKDLILVAASVVAFGVITFVHGLIGPSPFPV